MPGSFSHAFTLVLSIADNAAGCYLFVVDTACELVVGRGGTAMQSTTRIFS